MTLVDKASEAESRLKRPEFPWITGFQNFRCFAESKNITIPLVNVWEKRFKLHN